MTAIHQPHTRRLLLFAAFTATVVVASLAQPAAAHRNGSWMFPQEIMQTLEARHGGLAMCAGRGPARYRGDPRPSYAQFRHFECFLTSVPGKPDRVFCVHTLLRKRVNIAPPKPAGHRCRF